VTGRARQLHPRITSLSPRLFSPQRNGVKDATTLRFYVPDREHATIAVTNGRGQAVRRADVGNVRRGSHTWTWNGRTRSGTVVPSGRYRITVNTSRVIRQTLVRGAVWTSATVDDLAPRITRLRAPSTIYPVRDRYKDALVVTGYLGESARVALAVSNPAGRTVKSVRTRHGAGHFSLEWNGRDAAGRIMPGTYRWSLTATDSAGNTRVLRSHRVVVSAKRLVTQHAVIERNGDAFVSAGASDPYCGKASTSLSQWTHGVWLSNACAGESAVVAAFYRVRVPYAVRYTRLGVLAGGSALFIPSSMEAVFGVNGGSQNFGIPGYYELRSRKAAWWGLGSLPGSRYVSPRHSVFFAVSVDSTDAPCDFDLGKVRLRVTYQVLR
jgi:flagellar hook assembly protein FlgD